MLHAAQHLYAARMHTYSRWPSLSHQRREQQLVCFRSLEPPDFPRPWLRCCGHCHVFLSETELPSHRTSTASEFIRVPHPDVDGSRRQMQFYLQLNAVTTLL